MPYDWLDSKEKLQETSLPPGEVFYSQLNDEHLSNEDYKHAKKVWDIVFTNQTMNDYLLMYMWPDIILVASIMVNFRNFCIKDCTLNPCHYVDLPSLEFGGCLQMTKKNIELFTDSNIQICVEREIRGGYCLSSLLKGEVNNEFLKENHDPEKLKNYIMFRLG